MNLRNIVLGALASSLIIGSGCSKQQVQEKASKYSLIEVTDLDLDDLPDVIRYKNISYGGKDTYVFKEGYGPAQSVGNDVVVEVKPRNEFYTMAMPALMDSYARVHRLGNLK
jgi:hypothetical protein